MRNVIISFIILILLLSCVSNNLNKKYSIPIRCYKKEYSKLDNYTMYVNFENNKNSKLFSYKCEEYQPGIKTLKIDSIGNLFHNNQKLELVDVKKIKIGDSIIEVKKYINAKTSNLYDLSYFYLNDDFGFILTHNLNYDNIVEYDTKKFSIIHNIIINDTLLFKESDYVIESRRELKELNKNIIK